MNARPSWSTGPDAPGSRSPVRRSAPAGVGPAPVLATVLLVVVAVASVALLGGPVPGPSVRANSGALGDVPDRTPAPVQVFVPQLQQKPHVTGTIAFVKAGNIWTVTGDDTLTQVTSSGIDRSPVWSPDGRTLYFLQIESKFASVPCSSVSASGCIGSTVHFNLAYPVVSSMTMPSGSPVAIKSGLYSWGGGAYTYFNGLWQPSLSPDGKTLALISDAPSAFTGDYRLQLLSLKTGKLTRPSLPEDVGLGHDDPAWSPDGTAIAYTYNHREGTVGRPRIALYDVRKGTSRFVTPPGYAQPSWSPDGRYLAAVRTTTKGRDLVILDATTGAEVLRLTSDGHSFAPVWSPAGDQIAFLRASGLDLDLWVDTLAVSGSVFSVTKEEPLTSQSLLDATSKPAWFVPPGDLPASPVPTVPASPTSSGAASPSTSPSSSTGP
jgi:Tol biopolymer transport system component